MWCFNPRSSTGIVLIIRHALAQAGLISYSSAMIAFNSLFQHYFFSFYAFSKQAARERCVQ